MHSIIEAVESGVAAPAFAQSYGGLGALPPQSIKGDYFSYRMFM